MGNRCFAELSREMAVWGVSYGVPRRVFYGEEIFIPTQFQKEGILAELLLKLPTPTPMSGRGGVGACPAGLQS